MDRVNDVSPATSWAELSATETPYIEALASSLPVDGFALCEMLVPVDTGVSFGDPSTPYTQLSMTATPQTELTGPSTSWTELTG